jgi:hypothetical protein
MVHRRRRALATAVSAVTLAIAGWSAAPASAAIVLSTTDDRVVARFTSLSCRVDKAGFHARQVVRGWRLVVRVFRFDGFHRYLLEYGEGEGRPAFFIDPPGGGDTFSNANEPRTDVPRLTIGGAILFPRGRRTLRLNFPIAYDGEGPRPNVVHVVGDAPCRFGRAPARR